MRKIKGSPVLGKTSQKCDLVGIIALVRALLQTAEGTQRSIAVGNSPTAITGGSGIVIALLHSREFISSRPNSSYTFCHVARFYCAEVRELSRFETMYFEATCAIQNGFLDASENVQTDSSPLTEDLRDIGSGRGWTYS